MRGVALELKDEALEAMPFKSDRSFEGRCPPASGSGPQGGFHSAAHPGRRLPSLLGVPGGEPHAVPNRLEAGVRG
jgi:hypothetical protein